MVVLLLERAAARHPQGARWVDGGGPAGPGPGWWPVGRNGEGGGGGAVLVFCFRRGVSMNEGPINRSHRIDIEARTRQQRYSRRSSAATDSIERLRHTTPAAAPPTQPMAAVATPCAAGPSISIQSIDRSIDRPKSKAQSPTQCLSVAVRGRWEPLASRRQRPRHARARQVSKQPVSIDPELTVDIPTTALQTQRSQGSSRSTRVAAVGFAIGADRRRSFERVRTVRRGWTIAN